MLSLLKNLELAVGVSVGGIYYVLNALIDEGFVKLGNFTAAEDKRRYEYVLTPKGIARKATLMPALLKKKTEEYEALSTELGDAPRSPVGNSDAHMFNIIES